MTEWWQQDEKDVPAPVPRRDVVPESGFTHPRDSTPAAEVARFIPEFRVRRRKIAIVLTAIVAMIAAGWVAAIMRQYREADPSGAWTFLYFGFFLGGAGFSLARIWRWANEKDPRDSQPLRP